MATQAAARQPVSSAPGAKLKILRIGIIQGGRIVEERLVRKRENMTILFQFVTPPPPQPRPQLPASVRGSALSGIDWFFTTVAAVSFLLHLIFVIYLRNVDWPRKPDIEAVPDRFVQMVVKKEEKKPEEKKPEVAKTEEEKKPEKKKGDEEAKKPK